MTLYTSDRVPGIVCFKRLTGRWACAFCSVTGLLKVLKRVVGILVICRFEREADPRLELRALYSNVRQFESDLQARLWPSASPDSVLSTTSAYYQCFTRSRASCAQSVRGAR